jgi:hypothetical protein
MTREQLRQNSLTYQSGCWGQFSLDVSRTPSGVAEMNEILGVLKKVESE